MRSLLPILLGLLAVPPGAVLGVLVTYAVLALRMPEDQGRRGLLAAVLGSVPGAIGGFIAVHALVTWLRAGGAGAWRGVVAGGVAAVLAALLVGTIGLYAGFRWAVARGVSNYAGERGLWALVYVALPAALAAGILGYLAGRALI